MRKLLSLVLVCCFAVLYSAGKEFEKLGNYTSVKVVGITWKGIRITHSGGNCYITDKDLSAEEQKLLEQELKSWREKAVKHQKRVKVQSKSRVAQEKELQAFMKKIGKMSMKDICKWCRDKIGCDPYDPNFQSTFYEKYNFAGNSKKAMEACMRRLTAIDNADLKKLQTSCMAGDMKAANRVLQKALKVNFGPEGNQLQKFTAALNMRFPWATQKKAFINALKAKDKKERMCVVCKKKPAKKPGGICDDANCKKCTKCKKKDSPTPGGLCDECKKQEAPPADEGGGDMPEDMPPA